MFRAEFWIGVSFLIFIGKGFAQSNAQNGTEFTFLNVSGNCMLYAKHITLTVYDYDKRKEETGPSVQIYSIPLKNVIQTKAEGRCNEYVGDITLNLKGAASTKSGQKVDSLVVRMMFNYSQALNWWHVDEIKITGSGSLFANGRIDLSYNQTQTRGYIDGPKHFCYACGQMRPFMFYERPSGEQAKIKVKYGLEFANLQIQPFRINNTHGRHWYGFTDNVYDCVPFMSVGVWMFLVSTSILLCIVLSGIFMLASLKSNDRFDDIKGKPLVINVKE